MPLVGDHQGLWKRGGTVSQKIKYRVRYRSDAAPRGGYVTSIVEAESESDAIDKVRRQHSKATEIVGKPR